MDYWVIHHPTIDFHGAGGRGRGCHPWLCKYAPSIRTGVESTQSEERDKAADAHCIARVLCDEFLFFVFLAKALKKNTAFEQSYIVVISKNSHVCIHKLCSLCVRLQIQFPGNNNLGRGEKG